MELKFDLGKKIKAHGKTTEYTTPVVSKYGFPEHRTEKQERRIDDGRIH